MKIASFIKTTYTDYPGKQVSSILFTEGCNLKCGWCHNSDLVNQISESYIDPYEVIDYVSRSNHKSLVICGGEPTQQ